MQHDSKFGGAFLELHPRIRGTHRLGRTSEASYWARLPPSFYSCYMLMGGFVASRMKNSQVNTKKARHRVLCGSPIAYIDGCHLFSIELQLRNKLLKSNLGWQPYIYTARILLSLEVLKCPYYWNTWLPELARRNHAWTDVCYLTKFVRRRVLNFWIGPKQTIYSRPMFFCIFIRLFRLSRHMPTIGCSRCWAIIGIWQWKSNT